MKRILSLLLALVFVVCTGRVLYQLHQYRQGDRVYAQAEELVKPPASPVETPEVPDAPEEPKHPPAVQTLLDMDLSALTAVNGDVLGWIEVPDTPVAYPIVQAADNQYYLERTWNKASSSVGAIFLDWHVSADFSDFNTVIYGHRMRNNSMFGTLKYYSKADYWAAHPAVYIVTEAGVSRYDIFAAYEVSVLGTTYQMEGFEDEVARRDFLDFCTEQSVIDTDVSPTPDTPVLTLSTCTGNGYATRWVVQAALAETYSAAE